MKALFEPNGAATPEFRAAILGELCRLIAIQTIVVPYGEALSHILNVTSCSEEQVGGEVVRAWFLLERLGLIKTNSLMSVGAATNAIPSRLATEYIWDDQVWFEEGESA
jgi:hypothetical protein